MTALPFDVVWTLNTTINIEDKEKLSDAAMRDFRFGFHGFERSRELPVFVL